MPDSEGELKSAVSFIAHTHRDGSADSAHRAPVEAKGAAAPLAHFWAGCLTKGSRETFVPLGNKKTALGFQPIHVGSSQRVGFQPAPTGSSPPPNMHLPSRLSATWTSSSSISGRQQPHRGPLTSSHSCRCSDGTLIKCTLYARKYTARGPAQ